MSSSADKERAQHISEMFQAISRDFAGLENLPFPDVLELVEQCQDCLDEVWKDTEYDPSYPERRMRHLLEVMGTLLFGYPIFSILMLIVEIS